MGSFVNAEAEFRTRKNYLKNLGKCLTSILDDEDIECLICSREMRPLQNLDADDDLKEHAVVVHDKHIIGEECLRIWLKNTNTCPICRGQLFEDGGYGSEDEDGYESEDEVLPYEEWTDPGTSDYLLLISLRRKFKSHITALNKLRNWYWVIDHALRTYGEAYDNELHLHNLLRWMLFRAHSFQAGNLCDNVNYAEYSRRHESPERSDRRVFINAAKINSALWKWYVDSLEITKGPFKIQAHAFTPRLLLKVLKAVREMHGLSTSTEVVERLESRLGEVEVPNCWQIESLVAFRDDLIAAVLKLARDEDLEQ